MSGYYPLYVGAAYPASGGGSGDMVLASVQTVTGAKTFNDSTLLLANVAGTFSSKFTNTNTAARTYTLPDAAGTVALTSNITGTNSGTNTGDQTITLTGAVTGSGTGSFVASLGSFTKSQLDTAVSDGNVMYVGDAPSAHNHAASEITSGTLSVARGGTGLAAIGTALQVLRTNAGATALEYATLSAGGIGGSTGATDNRILRSDGTGGATVQGSLVTIDDSGNVGVNTSTPSATLEVSGTAGSASLRISYDTINTADYTFSRNSGTGYLQLVGSQVGLRGFDVNGPITINGANVISQGVAGLLLGNASASVPAAGIKISFDAIGTADYTIKRNGGTGFLEFAGNQAGFTGFTFNNRLDVTGPISASGNVTIGGGTAITKVLSATATLDFPSIGSNDTHTLTMTVTGAVAGNSVFLGVPAALDANLIWCASVTAADTVTIRMHNASGASIDPASGTYRATVFQF